MCVFSFLICGISGSLMRNFQITPTQFLETVNSINEVLISAHSLRHSFVDNALSFFTLHLSRLVTTSHYEKVSTHVISTGFAFIGS